MAHCVRLGVNEVQAKDGEVWTVGESLLQAQVSAHSSFYRGLLPAMCFFLSVTAIAMGHLSALVGDEQVWPQEDDGRLPRGGEGASSLHWSLAKRLLPSFFRHTRSPTEKSGRAEMSHGHIKKKKSLPVCFAFICKSVPLPGILIWSGS